MVCPFQEVRSDSGTAYPRCNENEHCQIHWETGKGQQVGENSESEYRQLCTIVTESGGINGGFIFLSRFEDFR